MKVAFFTDTYLPQINGVSKTIARLRNYLFNRGIESIVLMPDTGITNNDETVHCFKSLQLPFYPELRLAIPWEREVEAILSKFQPDIIHLVTEFTMGYAGLRWAKKHNVLIISSYHTNFADYAAYYNYPFLSQILWNYLVWFHNQCSLNLCPSNDTLETLKTKGMKNLSLWGRGIDGRLFNPSKKSDELRKKYKVAHEDIMLLYVGRLAPEKDLNVLVDAFKIVKKEYSNVKLIIAGDGPSRQGIEALNIPDIILTGELNQEELAPLYASCDIFTFPSTSETYGNVVLEAMACGAPVVAPLCGGIKENLKNGFNGLSHKPHDAKDMAKAIIKLIDDEKLRSLIGIQARIHAESRTWDQVLSVVVEGYYSNINKPKTKLA